MKINNLLIDDFTDYQFSLSTGEDELNYFSGSTNTANSFIRSNKSVEAGKYRVIDGELYRIVSDAPPLEG